MGDSGSKGFPLITQPSSPVSAPTGNDQLFISDLMHNMVALRRYAVRLAASLTDAEDLMQDTVLKCWGARTRFIAGTNFLAWARTIMRNTFFTSIRRRRFEVDAPDEAVDRWNTVAAAQEAALELRETAIALGQLAEGHKRAVLLASEGVSTEEGAAALGIPPNTYKSWVRRGRARLAALLDGREPHVPPARLASGAPTRSAMKPTAGKRDWTGVVIG